MSDPYVGEIRMFGGTFAPNGWAGWQINIHSNRSSSIYQDNLRRRWPETFNLPILVAVFNPRSRVRYHPELCDWRSCSVEP